MKFESHWPKGSGGVRAVPEMFASPPGKALFFSTPLPIINDFHLTLPPTITHFIVLRRPIFLFIRSTTHKQQYFFLLHAIVLIIDK